MSNLLMIDWDFFFKNPLEAGDFTDPTALLYDWGHAESQLFIEILWPTRGEAFLRNGLELPRVDVPENFWDRFTFTDDAVAEVSDSNMYSGIAGDYAEYENVVLFDAHHDLYEIKTLKDLAAWQEKGKIDCETWMFMHYLNGSDLYWRYPKFLGKWGAEMAENVPEWVGLDAAMDDGKPWVDLTFDTVSICRSGAWVPSWCDKDFEKFYLSCPVSEINQVDETDLVRESGTEEAIRAYAAQLAPMYQQQS